LISEVGLDTDNTPVASRNNFEETEFVLQYCKMCVWTIRTLTPMQHLSLLELEVQNHDSEIWQFIVYIPTPEFKLTSWSRDRFLKLLVHMVLKKFPEIYGIMDISLCSQNYTSAPVLNQNVLI
jgi:hypothetical protein